MIPHAQTHTNKASQALASSWSVTGSDCVAYLLAFLGHTSVGPVARSQPCGALTDGGHLALGSAEIILIVDRQGIETKILFLTVL